MKRIISRMLSEERHKIKNHIKYQKIYDRYLSKSKKHLDFGCGFGFFPYMLACEYPTMKVIGIERRREEIANGKKRYNARNLTLIVSNKIIGKFDTISCFNVLHEIVGDLNTYLKGFCSHLNPHGKIIIYDFRKVSKKKFKKFQLNPLVQELRKNKIFKKKDLDEEYKEHNKWNIKQFVSMLEKAGFKKREIKTEEVHLFYVGERK